MAARQQESVMQLKKVLPVLSPLTFFPASTLWTNKLKLTYYTTKQRILMQNLYKVIMTTMMKTNGLPKTCLMKEAIFEF